MTTVRFRIDLAHGCAIGPGKIALLEAIAEYGSLSAAAQALGMSYRRAWLLLASLNRSFRRPVAVASVGGRGGGGVKVTALGQALVRAYRGFETDVGRLASRRWRALARSACDGGQGPRPVNLPASRPRRRFR
jgi:molybdate transport system regulatory protein